MSANLSLLSPTRTFKHEPFLISNSRRILRRTLSSLLEHSSEQRNRQGFHIPDLRRCLSPGIRITLNLALVIDARSAQSACAHTAIVNIAALMYGEILIDSTVFQTWSCSPHRITGDTLAVNLVGVAHNHHCQVFLTASQELNATVLRNHVCLKS